MSGSHSSHFGNRFQPDEVPLPFAIAGLSIMGTISAVALSVAPWRIPLRTALVRRRLDTFRWLRWRSLPFRVRKGGLLRSKIKQGWATRSVATERCVPKGNSPAPATGNRSGFPRPYPFKFCSPSQPRSQLQQFCSTYLSF